MSQQAHAPSTTGSSGFPLLLAAILTTAAVVFGLTSGSTEAERWLLAARYTARAGAGFFLIVFLTAPLARSALAPRIQSISSNRRNWGLAFALAHTVHLGALSTFFAVSGEQLDIVTLVGGGGGYVLLGLMVLTSNNWSRRRLGGTWSLLHTVGLFYIWFVFATSYGGRLSDPDRFWIGVIGSVCFWAALVVRISLRKRRR